MKTTVLSAAIALALTTGATFAESNTPAPMVDDRVADQSMSVVGDRAVLAFVMFEDIQMDFSSICAGECRFVFKVDDGLLTLTGVEQRYMRGGDLYIIEGDGLKEVAVAARTPVDFNGKLREELTYYPAELLVVGERNS